MKIQEFIQKRKDGWLSLEKLLTTFEKRNRSIASEDYASFLTHYRKTVCDLSILRSNAANDPLVNRLNNLIVRALSVISSQPLNDRERIKYFWAESAPQLILAQRKQFLLSLLIFSVAIVFGFILTYIDQYTANAIVGDSYIAMTIENIQKGDPFGVYKSGFKYLTSSYIMANNIKVAFFAFAAGILYGVGTFYILAFNGLMFGSITAFFFQFDLGVDFLSTVMIHGTLELFAIVVAGAAGLRLGQSIYRPGRLARKEALYRFGHEAFQLAVLMVPIFIIAGLFEGYVTPRDLPMYSRILIILSSALLLVAYLFMPIHYFNKRKKRIVETVQKDVTTSY